MKIGDAVIVRQGRYAFNRNAVPLETPRWVWEDLLGIIIDDSGDVDGTGEYQVYTTDGKHGWCHIAHLRIAE